MMYQILRQSAAFILAVNLAISFPLPAHDTAEAATRNKAARPEQAPLADDTLTDTLKDAPAAPVLACSGPFARDASHADLVAAFGEKNVVFKATDGADGRGRRATIVFENDPVKQIIVYWRDPQRQSGVAAVTAAAPSTWIGPAGIRNGLPLGDVEKLNGGSFSINGFEATDAGLSSGLKGPLAQLPGGCTLSVRFEPGIANPLPKKFSAITGERKIPSSDKLMRRARPMVSEWTIGYN